MNAEDGRLELATDFGALPADAARVLAEAGGHDFQIGLPWLRNLTQTVDFEDAQPLLAIWRVHGSVAVLLPLLRRRSLLGWELSSLGNYYTTRWAPVVPDGTVLTAQSLAAALRALLRHLAPVSRLSLKALDERCSQTLLQPSLRQAGCAVFERPGFANWILPVTEPWPQYLASRDGRLRTTLQRMTRRFAQQGGRLELVQGGPRLDAAVQAYGQVYASSWKAAEPHVGFMPGLMRTAAASGQLRMALAWMGERPVAAQVWLMSGRRAEIYKLAHDDAFKACSPGTLLTAALMKHSMELDGVQTVDYLSGDDEYKRLWMSHRLRRVDLMACPRSTLGGILELAKGRAVDLRNGARGIFGSSRHGSANACTEYAAPSR